MSTERGSKNNKEGRDKSSSRDRDLVNRARQKYDNRRQQNKNRHQRSLSAERRKGQSYGRRHDYPPYDNDMPQWRFPPPMRAPGHPPPMGHPSSFGPMFPHGHHHEFHRPLFMGRLMDQVPGPMYHDLSADYYPDDYNDYGGDCYDNSGVSSTNKGSRFGGDVLEKAETMVNVLAEKRKQATQGRVKNRKSQIGSQSLTSASLAKRSTSGKEVKSISADNSPRLTLRSWSKATKSLVERSSVVSSSKADHDDKETTHSVEIRDSSPVRTRPTTKVDVSKVASKSDSLNRASIAKLINAPRSTKEKQRLASLVKKTKTKASRPKLNVHSIPEVGSFDPSELAVDSEMLDLVELPEHLRRQVENLFEHGPLTAPATDPASPQKSPVAKKAKTDRSFVDNKDMFVKLELVSEDELTTTAAPVIKAEPVWETESVVSDVTSDVASVDQSVDDRTPFEKLADKVTVDPELNNILSSGSMDSVKERPETPSEADLLDSDRIEEMVHQALGVPPPPPKEKSLEEHEFKRPNEPVRRRSHNREDYYPSRENRSLSSSVSKSSQSTKVTELVETKSEACQMTNQPGQEGVKSPVRAATLNNGQTSSNRLSNASLISGSIVAETSSKHGVLEDYSPEVLRSDTLEVPRGASRDNDRVWTAADLLDSADKPLSLASKALALAKNKMQEMGDSLMSLHLAIHNTGKTEDTVNLVLEITEREEQLSAETAAIDQNVESLKALMTENWMELDRMMKLRDRVRGAGEILRKQRLDVLRKAVSKKKDQDATSTDNVTSTTFNWLQPVTSSSDVKASKPDDDADHCSLDSAESTPRAWDHEVTKEPMAVEYVGSLSMDLIHSGQLWKTIESSKHFGSYYNKERQSDQASESDQTFSDTVLDKAAGSSMENLEQLDNDDSWDEIDPPDLPLRFKKRMRERPLKRKLGVRMLSQRKKLKTKPEITLPKSAPKEPKQKDKKDMLLVMCRKLASPISGTVSARKIQEAELRRSMKDKRMRSKAGDSLSEVESNRYRVRFDGTDEVTDDVTNDESELDCPEKVKARLLKAVNVTESRQKVRSDKKRQTLKSQLLESLEAKVAHCKSSKIYDPLVKSTMLDHEIAVKLEQCSSALKELEENKLKQKKSIEGPSMAKVKTSNKKEETNSAHTYPGVYDVLKKPSVAFYNGPSDVTDDVSIVSDNVTTVSVATSKTETSTSSSRRRRSKRRNDREERLNTVIISSSESDHDHEALSDRLRIAAAKKPVYPSDSRKDKLRQMGVILSASELEEFCKDGHNISDMDSNSEIRTARTEDLLIQTPRSTDIDTARTEDLLKAIHLPRPMGSRTTTPSETPLDDSDSYSSCVEEVDVLRALQSTGDSLNFSPLDSSQSDGQWRNIKSILLDENKLGSSNTATEDESRIEEKYENEKSKESMSTDRSDDLAEYRQRMVRMLDESSDTDVNVKQETHVGIDDDVMFLGAVEPTSARSDKSTPSVGDKKKFKGHSSAVTSMVLHGQYLFTSSSQERVIRKYDVHTCECVHTLKTPSDNISTMITVDYNGRSFLYTGGYDQKLIKYDLESHESVSSKTLHAKIRCLVTKWDKLFIGLCSGQIISMNLDTDSCKALVTSGKSVSCMDTGQEGSRQILVVGTFDPLISVHDSKNGLLLRTIMSHSRVPLSIQVCHNIIYSAGAEKCIKLHDLNCGDEIRSSQLRHPVTDIVVHSNLLYVACFDGIIRCYNKDLELKGLYYGAGRNSLLRLRIHEGKLYSTNKDGCVESAPIVDGVHMCPCKECQLGFGLISDLEYHVTEKHIHSRLEDNNPVYYCSWIGCCFETPKRMDLENHLLNHVEILANDDHNV